MGKQKVWTFEIIFPDFPLSFLWLVVKNLKKVRNDSFYSLNAYNKDFILIWFFSFSFKFMNMEYSRVHPEFKNSLNLCDSYFCLSVIVCILECTTPHFSFKVLGSTDYSILGTHSIGPAKEFWIWMSLSDKHHIFSRFLYYITTKSTCNITIFLILSTKHRNKVISNKEKRLNIWCFGGLLRDIQITNPLAGLMLWVPRIE